MRKVSTRRPSFPAVVFDSALAWPDGERWNVLCGDEGHWRCGVFSPPQSDVAQIDELEWHDCPELFLLLSGQVTLVLSDNAGGVRELSLEPGRPVLVSSPHSAYCPAGSHSGVCFVVERDEFETEYRDIQEWK
ncbi:MAG TPA: hypothetical protein PLY68_05615 [Myxococcota bacterium]|nr:hypothetical protein [Myxococcota bacterium]HOD06525.1 hypothetical protein [Myxococcota bacterium]HPB50555.1 hypothetical protein [Myxococcota bacterium]HQP95658.1 hypothetical protein [Myxococcota bacterium]